MSNYPLNELSSREFEKLVALICERILGAGTLIFSDGKDGGRDVDFTGKANHFPSESKPWEGKFIIQAKHTSNPTASILYITRTPHRIWMQSLRLNATSIPNLKTCWNFFSILFLINLRNSEISENC